MFFCKCVTPRRVGLATSRVFFVTKVAIWSRDNEEFVHCERRRCGLCRGHCRACSGARSERRCSAAGQRGSGRGELRSRSAAERSSRSRLSRGCAAEWDRRHRRARAHHRRERPRRGRKDRAARWQWFRRSSAGSRAKLVVRARDAEWHTNSRHGAVVAAVRASSCPCPFTATRSGTAARGAAGTRVTTERRDHAGDRSKADERGLFIGSARSRLCAAPHRLGARHLARHPRLDHGAALGRRQSKPVLFTRFRRRSRHGHRALGRRHPDQHGLARAWPGVLRHQLHHPRDGRAARHFQRALLREPGRLCNGRRGQLGHAERLRAQLARLWRGWLTGPRRPGLSRFAHREPQVGQSEGHVRGRDRAPRWPLREPRRLGPLQALQQDHLPALAHVHVHHRRVELFRQLERLGADPGTCRRARADQPLRLARSERGRQQRAPPTVRRLQAATERK